MGTGKEDQHDTNTTLSRSYMERMPKEAKTHVWDPDKDLRRRTVRSGIVLIELRMDDAQQTNKAFSAVIDCTQETGWMIGETLFPLISIHCCNHKEPAFDDAQIRSAVESLLTSRRSRLASQIKVINRIGDETWGIFGNDRNMRYCGHFPAISQMIKAIMNMPFGTFAEFSG